MPENQNNASQSKKYSYSWAIYLESIFDNFIKIGQIQKEWHLTSETWENSLNSELVNFNILTFWNRLPTSLKSRLLDVLAHWGLGIVILYEKQLIRLIYQQNKVHLQLLSLEPWQKNTQEDFRIYVQQFRQQNRLHITFGIVASDILDWCQNNRHFEDFFCNYGKFWFISVPMEWDDFVFFIPQLLHYFSIQQSYKNCHLDKKNLLELVRTYLKNGWNFLKKNSIFLRLKDNESVITWEISSNGIYEIEANRELPENCLFVFNTEMMASFWPWLSDTSLRLLTKFVSEIVPAEISKTIYRTETLIYLKVRNTKHETLDLFLLGSQQHLPFQPWKGDCYSMLMMPKTRKMIWQQNLPDIPLVVSGKSEYTKTTSNSLNGKSGISQINTNEFNQCHIHIPAESQLYPLDNHNNLYANEISFNILNSVSWKQGLKRYISNTSVFADIIPGLQTESILGELQGMPILELNGIKYQAYTGSFCHTQITGRIIQQNGHIDHLRQIWCNGAEAGMMTNCKETSHYDTADWWKKFIQDTYPGGFTIRPTSTEFYSSKSSWQPLWKNEKQIIWDEIKQKKLRYWIWAAYAIPWDMYGNFVIRCPSLVISKRKIGIGILEFPCRITEKISKPISLQIQKKSNSIHFMENEVSILTIDNARAIKVFQPSCLWFWRYILSRFAEIEE